MSASSKVSKSDKSTKSTKSTSDISSTDFYGESPELTVDTAPKDEFTHSITVNQFINDVKLRFPEESKTAVQILVYFYSKDDVYESEEETTYGLRTTRRNYVTLRPAVVSFVSVDSVTKKPKMVVKSKGLEVYDDYGIKFQTHIPIHVWDDSRKRYTSEVRKDADGNVMYKLDKELKPNMKVNLLRIVNEQKHFTKQRDRFALTDTTIDYYDWRIEGVKDDSKPAEYMLKNIKRSQFEPLDTALSQGHEIEDITFE